MLLNMLLQVTFKKILKPIEKLLKKVYLFNN